MAYFNAVNKWIYKDGGFGVEPKIVYRYGYVDGKFFDPWEETFENSIQKPVFRNGENYDGIGSRWVTLGTPKYDKQEKRTYVQVYPFSLIVSLFFSCSDNETDIDLSYHYDTSISYDEKVCYQILFLVVSLIQQQQNLCLVWVYGSVNEKINAEYIKTFTGVYPLGEISIPY